MTRAGSPPRADPILRDFIEVRAHPTVVRLDHLEMDDSAWITSAYHTTRDATNHLQAVRRALSRPAGCGMFVIGQYGSGKSHFLAYLAQLLRDGGFLPRSPRVLPISLLNFRAETALEDIVSEAVGGALGTSGGTAARTRAPAGQDRRTQWAAVAGKFPDGLLILLDELSEFLRSKPDRRAFNEDIRFLQFLGEWAQGERLWVLAAMQEQIEHTGDLDVGMYRKIKDRFPLRFLLTPAHVKDLLSEGILVRREGFEEAVEEVIVEVREAFPTPPLDLEELRAVYPIHPATLELLEEVRDQFSQARGVVDFTVTQLAGDPARRVAPFLDRPWGSLLTPDTIIDHFLDLFEIQPEFLPLAQQLLPHYRKHLDEIFDTEAQRQLAWRLLKLLMLVHLSPEREGLPARDAAGWLLYRAARIDPQKNTRIVERVLRQLAERGRYVALRRGLYTLNLEDDGGTALERFLEREKAELRERGDVILEMLVPLLGENDFHPFLLPRDEWQQRTVRWHFHERPYAVCFGNESPPARDGLALCLRLPWGNAAAAPGVYTIAPAPIERGEEQIELAALARARERPWSGDVARRLAARFEERLAIFRTQLRNALLDATVRNPAGEPETPPHIDRSLPFHGWLDAWAEWVLRRSYPAFERFAPSHGPLAKEAYRSLMRFASHHDLGDYDADEYVKLIREAYLVPMGLMKRKGRGYVFPENPDRNELVRRVLPMLDMQPAPEVVYAHLAEPVYGLVPDQISLLLIYLLLLGEIDIVKGKRSYRELYESLPNPIHYDRIVPGRALPLEQLHALGRICEGLRLKAPKEWTVLAQRRAVRRLREELRRRVQPLERLLLKLEEADQGQSLAERLRKVIGQWSALTRSDDELEGWQQFLFEVGSASRFLSAMIELEGLPERIDRLLSELSRVRHLLAHPLLASCRDPALALRIEALPEAPGLEEPDALEGWLDEARRVYGEHRDAYRELHDAWWRARAEHPIWSWQAPRLAGSRHLRLDAELGELRACRERAARSRCRGLVDLDFQPICTCGFDGETAPIEDDLRRFKSTRSEIGRALTLFFGQEEVRERVKAWVEEGIEVNPRTLAYLGGQERYPEVEDLAQFDRYLAGVEVVREVDAGEVVDLLEERTWERGALLAALEKWLDRLGSERLRFTRGGGGRRAGEGFAGEIAGAIGEGRPGEGDGEEEPGRVAAARGARAAWSAPRELLAWCAQQALRFGVPLPRGLGAAS
ncbi:MAG: DUF6079 family protein, partial [Planctomycetota bacterium]